MSSQKTPKWLIPAIAAGLVAILTTVLIFALGGDDDSTVTNPTTGTSTSTSTSTTTEPEKLCANGERIPASETCPSVESSSEVSTSTEEVTCWDDSTAAVGGCPTLTGQAAFEWLFPVPSNWNRSCQTYTGAKYQNELETYYCVVTELPDVRIYLSRWTSVDDATAKFTELFEVSPSDFTLKDSSTGDSEVAGKEWINAELTSDASGKPLGIYADLYGDVPYSIYIEYDDPAGVGKTTAQSWYDGQLYQDPDIILEQGSLP